jgi:hypothetical protein
LLTFAQVTKETASPLPTLCHLFWRADQEKAEVKLARRFPIAAFIDSLLFFTPVFAEDRDSYLWDCCLFAHVARLQDSVLGESFMHLLKSDSLKPPIDISVTSLRLESNACSPAQL